MKCLEREKVFEYIHHLLEPQEAETAREHLAHCDACRAVAAEYARLDGALKDWTAAEPSPWFDARLRARLAAEKEGGLWGTWGFLEWRRWLLPATVVALAVLAIVIFLQSSREPQPAAKQEAPRVAPPPTEKTQTNEVARAEKPTMKPAEKPGASAVEINGEENFSALEDYDLIADFDVLSELPGKEKRVVR